MAPQISSISQALNGHVEAMKIPAPAAIGTGMAGPEVTQNNPLGIMAKGGNRDNGLPTPPNSISPTLPDAFRANIRDLPGSPPSYVDSDIDLQDGSDHSFSKSEEEADGPDTAHITPQYLAKNHLASYVLDKGPIAVRHVMNHLSETVPGYNQIPSAKARRITVSALESKAGGGPEGNVEFEKVGWGRWDARVRGQPSREVRAMYSIREDRMSPPANAHSAFQPTQALQIPGSSERRRSKSRRLSYGSWAGESSLARSVRSETHDDDFGDAMSIDGDDNGLGHRSQARPLPKPLHTESSSDTEEEDWSTLGMNSHKDQFLGSSGPGRPSRMFTPFGNAAGQRSRSRGWSPHPHSLPAHNHLHSYQRQKKPDFSQMDFTGMNIDSQERDAVHALMKLGSM